MVKPGDRVSVAGLDVRIVASTHRDLADEVTKRGGTPQTGAADGEIP